MVRICARRILAVVKVLHFYDWNNTIFFSSYKERQMQKQINQISLQIAVSLLGDYIGEHSLQLSHVHQKFAREFTSKQEVDLHEWLITETKNINDSVRQLLEGTRDYFADIKFEFVYDFFSKCCSALQQNCRYLAQAILEKINRKIDAVRPHLFVSPAPPVIMCTSQQEVEEHKEEHLRRYSKEISRDLESLDYFLNLLAYEDSKTYQEYKSQCDKILLQRQNLENIKPSDASKEIMETANMIDNVMENSDKVFQDSYLLKYMQFKSFINDLKKPEEIGDLYRDDMENATKQKFKDGMSRTLKKCYAISKRENQKNRVAFGTQTDEVKGIKYQEKLQNLLIAQKKNNEKLTSEVKSLRRNKSNAEEQQQLQKMAEREDVRQKEADNKYRILELMYNEKCEELLKVPSQRIFVQKEQEKKQLIAIGLQAEPDARSVPVQTEMDFYYYFESNKIYDYKVRIVELEEELKHKEYIIKEMEAIRTFRDNFKSKKQVYSTAIRSTRNADRAKSLHYLNEDDQIYDVREDEKLAQSSLEGIATKKKVTLQDLDESGQARNKIISHSKKSKKKTEVFRNKPYFALNSKVQDEVQEEQKSECELQKVSIKSILKLGANQFKKEVGSQTDADRNGNVCDYVIQQAMGKSKIEKVKLSSRDRSERSMKTQKEKARVSEVSSLFKQPREKTCFLDEVLSLRKSNFVALGELNDHKEEKPMNMTLNSPLGRMSGISGGLYSPKKLLQSKTEKPAYFARASKWNENKVNTAGNEVLHVNNSLNCNFLAPITSNAKQPSANVPLLKNKSKYDSMKKAKPSKIM